MSSKPESSSPSSPVTCGSCQADYGSAETALAAGWGIWDGATHGGKQVRYVICPRCRGYAKTRTRVVSTVQDIPLWEE